MADNTENRPSIQVNPAPAAPVASPSTSSRDRRASSSSEDSLKKEKQPETPCEDDAVVQNVLLHNDDDDDDAPAAHARPGKKGTFVWAAMALTILAWWVSSIVLPISRHRWIVQSLWAWFFVLVIAFRFVPAALVARPVAALWSTTIAPLARIPFRARLALAWLLVLAITFASAFGIERPEGTLIADRVISLAGVFFFQLAVYAHSHNKKAIRWGRVPLHIITQQALALFILKSDAGWKFFGWMNTAVADFQTGAVEATAFVFDAETATKGWFFVSGLAVILFLAAWVQMLYFFGWMQWLTKQFAWFGQHLLATSGAETFVALWSPWFGQVNSALLVGPYVESMTDSEIFATMAVSMSSVSSLMIGAYTKLGFDARTLVAQSAMTMPGALVNAKMAFPEADRDAPLTRSRASTHACRKKLNLSKAGDLLESLCDGAYVGLRVAGSVLANFFVILGLLVFINGILIWIFRGFGVHKLDLHTVAAGPLFPLTFFLGVPRRELWGLAYLVSGKLLVSSDFAFAALAAIQGGPAPMSPRGVGVITMALANTANLGSLGVQMGVMTALAPSRKRVICRGVLPALIIATFTSLQTASIAASIL